MNDEAPGLLPRASCSVAGACCKAIHDTMSEHLVREWPLPRNGRWTLSQPGTSQ